MTSGNLGKWNWQMHTVSFQHTMTLLTRFAQRHALSRCLFPSIVNHCADLKIWRNWWLGHRCFGTHRLYLSLSNATCTPKMNNKSKRIPRPHGFIEYASGDSWFPFWKVWSPSPHLNSQHFRAGVESHQSKSRSGSCWQARISQVGPWLGHLGPSFTGVRWDGPSYDHRFIEDHRSIARITCSLELGVATWSICVSAPVRLAKKMEIYWFIALQSPFSISSSTRAYKCNTHVSRFSRDIHPQRCGETGGGFETCSNFFIGAVWQVLSQHGGCLHFTVGRVQPCVAWQRYSRKVAKVVIAHHFFVILNADINHSKRVTSI